MATVTNVTVTCDGCGKVVDWENILYRVWFTDSEGVHKHFCDFDCVKTWATVQQSVRNAKLTVAAKHTELHAALDAADNIDKQAWQEQNGIVESHSIEQVDKHLEDIGGAQNV